MAKVINYLPEEERVAVDGLNKIEDGIHSNDMTAPGDISTSDVFIMDPIKGDSSSWIWLHATYHCLVTIVGTGILGFPHATAYFGWAGSAILITITTAAAYYTSMLLVNLQKADQGTYSELANGAMGRDSFAKYWVRPFQYLNFFPTAAVMILVGGQAMFTMNMIANGGQETKGSLSETYWTVIMGAFVLVFSLLPDLNHVWQISLIGSIAVVLITVYCIVGPSIAIAEDLTSPDYITQPDSDMTTDAFCIMAALGSIFFGYGYHTILPDIHATNLKASKTEATKYTTKAVTSSFCYSYLAYLIVALLGYAAFGSTVDPNVLVDITYVLDHGAMYFVWSFVVIKTTTEATAYNQAAFTLLRDSLGMADENDHLDHHPKNKALDIVMRLIWVALATVVAIFVPYFGDLTSITGAISIVPLSFVLPIVFWNKVHGATAPLWRLMFHYTFIVFFSLLGVAALVGAVSDINIKVHAGQ